MKWKNILLIVGLGFVASACEKQDSSIFTTDDAGIYFQMVTMFTGRPRNITRIRSLLPSRLFEPRRRVRCLPLRFGRWVKWLTMIVLSR